MAITFKIIKRPVKSCVANINKMSCLLKLKWTFLKFIEGFTIQEKISNENVLFCVIQVYSFPIPYSLSIGWSKYI